MALKIMAGFDLYPGQVDANGYVVEGAGINSTHYGTIFQIVRTAIVNSPTVNLQLGVSGQAAHKMSPGSAIERNSLVFRRNGNINGQAYMRMITSMPAPTVGNFISTAFTLKLLSPFNTSSQDVPLVSLYSNTNTFMGSPLMIRASSVDGGIQFRVHNTIVPVANMPMLSVNKEYHIEMRLARKAGAPADNYEYQLYVDGDNVFTVTGVAAPTLTTEGGRWYWGSTMTNMNLSFNLLMSDLIVASSEPGLFATGIGPQLILPSKIASVTPGDWEKEGNATATDTLTDFDDTTYYASPVNAGAMSAKVAGAVTPFKALASEVLIRASRDRDAGRTLTAELRKADGSASLAPAVNIATGNGYNSYLLTRLEGIAEADIRGPSIRLNASVP